MVDQALLDRLDRLHEELKNQAILEEVAKLPREEQLDYQIQSRIGRALGNLHQHQAAFRVLETLEDQGKNDPMWWYRMACAWLGLADPVRAEEYADQALALDPDCEGAHEVKQMIQKQRRWRTGNSKKKGNKKEEEVSG